MIRDLKIYFTSDVHGYVYPTDYVDTKEKNMGFLNIINQFQKDGNTLIIDGGDTIQGSPFTNYLSSNEFNIHPIAEILNKGKYDFVTLGNHDFNYGPYYLNKYLSNLSAECVCANVTDKRGILPILPYKIKTLENGLKVGVIGITTDFINRWERPENIKDIIIGNTFDAVKEYFDDVKKNSDFVIGVYHGGFEHDFVTHEKLSHTSENIAYELCSKFDFDILLTGHQHLPICNRTVHGTHIVQTPHNGRQFIKITAAINDDNTSNIESSLITVESNPDKQMYDKFLDLENNVQKWLDTPVGFLDTELKPKDHITMALNGSELANFINQIQLDTSAADISCTSFSNVVKGFNKNVTVRDIMSTYPYPNTLVIKEVDRKILKLALERSASYFENTNGDIKVSNRFLKPKVEHYNYDYFSGIDYTFDLSRDVNDRVISIKYHGHELEDGKKLNLVMNNYRASGAGGYEFYENAPIVKEILVEMPEVIIEYFKTHPNVNVDKTKYLHTIF